MKISTLSSNMIDCNVQSFGICSVLIHKVVRIAICQEWLVFILCLFQILGLLPVYMVYWVCIIVIGAAMWTIFSLQFFFCYLLSTYLYYINLSNTFTNHDLKQPSPSIYANKRHVVQLSEQSTLNQHTCFAHHVLQASEEKTRQKYIHSSPSLKLLNVTKYFS